MIPPALHPQAPEAPAAGAPLAAQPTPFPGATQALRSPDGRWLLVHAPAQPGDAVLKGAHGLFLLDLKGGGTSRLLTYARHADACFSPDGRHLLLTEWTAADAATVRLYRLDGAPVRLSLDRWIGGHLKGTQVSSLQALGWSDARTFRLQWWGYSGEAERKSFRRGLEVRLDDGVREVYPREGEGAR